MTPTVPEQATAWLKLAKVAVGLMVVGLGAAATCSGWMSKAIETPARVERVEDRLNRWIMYQNLARCERESIPPTQCDPQEIPEPGRD